MAIKIKYVFYRKFKLFPLIYVKIYSVIEYYGRGVKT